MSNYDGNRSWVSLLPVIADHTEWFHTLLQNLFYPEIEDKNISVVKPNSFSAWVASVRGDGIIQEELIEKLVLLHGNLFNAADNLMVEAKQIKVKPEYKKFQTFLNMHEQFLHLLIRFERDFMLEGSGYDSFTGLRSPKVIKQDIERELHRLARRGQNFCIALAHIDNYEAIKEAYPDGRDKVFIKEVADLIKLSIRSFDDAYYMGGCEFVLCLKQADMAGGIAALDRLSAELEKKNINFDFANGEKSKLSMSCCIAQPVQGDDVDELINNLKKDLAKIDRQAGTVLEYYEVSPLQRYVQDTAQH